MAEGASDLHLSAGLKPRWRIDGEMIEILDQSPVGEEEVLDWIKPMMREQSIAEFRKYNDADFAINDEKTILAGHHRQGKPHSHTHSLALAYKMNSINCIHHKIK